MPDAQARAAKLAEKLQSTGNLGMAEPLVTALEQSGDPRVADIANAAHQLHAAKNDPARQKEILDKWEEKINARQVAAAAPPERQ